MATARELKEDIQFNQHLMDLLEVMKNVAVYQFRTLQGERDSFPIFTDLAESFFRMGDFGAVKNPFTKPATDKSAIIIVTSDEGFMGGLNFQVINTAINRADADQAELIIVGERGARYLKDLGKEFTAFKSAIDSGERRALAREVKDHVTEGILGGRFGNVSVSYATAVSFMIQEVRYIKLLPFAAGLPKEAKDGSGRDFIAESPLEGIIEYLVEEILAKRLVEILEESKLAEFSARAIHLEKSGQELEDKSKRLNMQYIHAYHELIDKSTRELFASQLIIKNR